jgi:hypothetical protein
MLEGTAVLSNLEPDVLVVGGDRHGNGQPHAVAACQPYGLPDTHGARPARPCASEEPRALAENFDHTSLAQVGQVEPHGHVAGRRSHAPLGVDRNFERFDLDRPVFAGGPRRSACTEKDQQGEHPSEEVEVTRLGN